MFVWFPSGLLFLLGLDTSNDRQWSLLVTGGKGARHICQTHVISMFNPRQINITQNLQQLQQV